MDRRVTPSHFLDIKKTVGDRAITVAFGGLSVRFTGLSDDLFKACQKRYALFLSESAPAHVVQLYAGEPSYLEPAPNRFLRLEESAYPQGQVLLCTDFAAFRERGKEEGMLALSDPDTEKAALRGLENYLRWVVADLALRGGGFVLHSAGLVRDGMAYVFFGRSGAGKSTVAGLSQDCILLSDDLVLIMRRNDGWRATTTPFWGTLAQEAKDLGVYPLAGLYAIEKDSRNALAPLSKALATGMLLACCPFVASHEVRQDKLVPLVEACALAIPTATLRFRKDPSFWTIIMQEASHG